MIAFYNSQIHFNASLDNIPHYQFKCGKCVYRTCWSPGIRTTETTGKNNPTYGRKLRFNANEVYICTWMFDFGCPNTPEEDKELAVQRLECGWNSAPI
jgi:hypothetical protein